MGNKTKDLRRVVFRTQSQYPKRIFRIGNETHQSHHKQRREASFYQRIGKGVLQIRSPRTQGSNLFLQH